MSKNTISVILPCYNEENLIEETLQKILKFSKNNSNYKFIFVNDGSTDRTLEILKRYENLHEKIQVSSYSPNKGKGYAIKKGIEKADDSDKIIFTDSDLAYSLNYLKDLESGLDDYDIVFGSRALNPVENSPRIKSLRMFIGKSYNILLRIALNLPYKDTQAGIKGFKKNVAKKIFSVQRMNNFSFDVEKLYLARKYGFKIKEIPASVSEEHIKKPSSVKILRDSINMFFNLFQIKFYDLTGKYEE